MLFSKLSSVQQRSKLVITGAGCGAKGLEFVILLWESLRTFSSEGVLHVKCTFYSLGTVRICGICGGECLGSRQRPERARQRPEKPSP